MKNQLVIINIGNTHTEKSYYSENNKLKKSEVYKTSDVEYDIVNSPELAVIASVVSEKTNLFLNKKNCLILTSDLKLNFNLDLVDKTTLGIDRLVNLIALAKLAKNAEIALPALSIDFGTCITFELIDENYNFLGGAIMPGRKLLRKTLNDNTSALPLIDISNTFKSKIGTNTKESILLGTDLASVGGVEKIIEGFEIEIKQKIKTILATGGDAKFFAKHIEKLELCNTLTTMGIMEAWEMNKELYLNES